MSQQPTSKTPISRASLRDKVMSAICAHPGCESVKDVAITPVKLIDIGSTWHVNVVDAGGAKIEVAYAVARQVQEALSPMFEVVD